MTIVAGFKSHHGIVLCADTQETVGTAKRHVPKLVFYPHNFIVQRADPNYLAAAFCGAGEGPFLDMLVERAWNAAMGTRSIANAHGAIEGTIKNTYREYGRIYQVGACPSVELVFGIRMGNQSKLFEAVGPVVNERTEYVSCGTGYYLAEFLAKRMFKNHLTIHQLVILAAYVLFQAKEHVDGCGGESQIAVLQHDGASGLVDARQIVAITELLKFADETTGDLLLEAANMDTPRTEFRRECITIIDGLIAVKEGKIKELEEARRMWQAAMRGLYGKTLTEERTDSLGLPMLSDDQMSEPEQ